MDAPPVELQTYLRHEVPPHLGCQIRSYTRMQWPGMNTRPALWDRAAEPNPSTHFVLTSGELLVAHACTRVRDVAHDGTTYRVAGLSTVFAYPDFRGRGLGGRVAGAATEHIRGASGADCAMLFCGQRVCSLYERLGWEHLPTARITYGDPPTRKTDNLIMMLFLSAKGRGARRVFEEEVVHVGPHTW